MLMYRFHIRHLLGRVNVVPDCVPGYPASEKDIRVTDNEKTQQIDSDIKTSFSSTYEHDPNLMAVT